MKLTIPALVAFSLCTLLLPAAQAQVQWASPIQPAEGYGPIQPPEGYGQGGLGSPMGVIQASACDACGAGPGSCGCGSGSGLGGAGLGGALGGLLGAGGGSAGGMLGSGGWLDAEYLLWWSKERYVPVLATTAVGDPLTPVNVAGLLGESTTSILYGDQLIGGDPQSGFRISTGRWLDQQRSMGLGFRYFMVGGEEDGYSQNSDGDPILARPFFDTTSGTQNASLQAYPGASTGSLNIVTTNEARGFDVYLRKLLLSGYGNRLDFIVGYHNSTVEDSVNISDSLTALSADRVAIGTRIDSHDNFSVENTFNGGFLGLMGTAEDGPLSWRMLAKIAYGSMNQEASISGSTVTSPPGGAAVTDNFGLLALGSNIGRFDDNESAIVPELNVSMAYNLNQNVQLLLGYTFIYWSDVAMAGDGIDTTINPTQIGGALVGESRPTFNLVNDDFWYQGISVGGSIRF